VAVALRRKQPRKAHRRGGGAPEEHTRNVRGTNIMRILIAFEDDYCAYADALAKAIRAARPHLDVVATVGLEALQTQTARLDPHLVISSVPNPAAEQEDEEEGKLILAWVELSLDPNLPSQFCIDSWRWETLNPSLEDLLDVIDETERLVLSRVVARKRADGY